MVAEIYEFHRYFYEYNREIVINNFHNDILEIIVDNGREFNFNIFHIPTNTVHSIIYINMDYTY